MISLSVLQDEQLKFFNVWVMGFGFMLIFTAYNTTQNYVTNLLAAQGWGNLGKQLCNSLLLSLHVQYCFSSSYSYFGCVSYTLSRICSLVL